MGRFNIAKGGLCDGPKTAKIRGEIASLLRLFEVGIDVILKLFQVDRVNSRSIETAHFFLFLKK